MIRLSVLSFVAASVPCLCARGGVLLDYGFVDSFNDAAVVRGNGDPSGAFGFGQFQSFYVSDEAWRVDNVTAHLRLWDVASQGVAEVAVYAADGLFPDLTGPIAPAATVRVDSLAAGAVTIDLGGVVLETGEYYIGLTAADPWSNLLWMPGVSAAAHHAVRSDGRMFTYYNPSLSLTLGGEVVPAPAGLLVLVGAGLFRRRR